MKAKGSDPALFRSCPVGGTRAGLSVGVVAVVTAISLGIVATGVAHAETATTFTTVNPPTPTSVPVAQTPANNCVACGTSSVYVPARDTKR